MRNIIGLRFIDNNFKTWRFTWGEISFGTLGLALDYTAGVQFDQRPHIQIRLPLIQAFLYIPVNHFYDGNIFQRPSWGFYYNEKALVLKFGQWSKYIHMPWSWEHYRHDVLMADGRWKRVAKNYYLGEQFNPDAQPYNWTDKWQEKHEYHYCLKNWTVQECMATIGVEEREWRWRWLMWLPFPRKINRTIDISFSDEVGERSGSWKGGTLGCGYELNNDETPLECLRRMERERKF